MASLSGPEDVDDDDDAEDNNTFDPGPTFFTPMLVDRILVAGIGTCEILEAFEARDETMEGCEMYANRPAFSGGDVVDWVVVEEAVCVVEVVVAVVVVVVVVVVAAVVVVEVEVEEDSVLAEAGGGGCSPRDTS